MSTGLKKGELKWWILLTIIALGFGWMCSERLKPVKVDESFTNHSKIS